MRALIDLEGNGLLPDLTKFWCAVALDIDTQEYHGFILKDGNYDEFRKFMDGVDLFIGHNILKYDIPALIQLGVYNYRRELCDTLVYSQALNPDRKLPEGCPTHLPDPITGKKKIVGPHGLESWGYRVGQFKPSIDCWTDWSPKILTRCQEDVGINYKALLMMLEEAEMQQIVSII